MDTTVTYKELTQFNVLTRTWLSETAFLTDEIRFLKKLVNHNTLFLTNETYLTGLLEMSRELTEIEKEVLTVREHIMAHFHGLYGALENGHFGAESVKDSHEVLEEQLAALTKKFRVIKETVINQAAKFLGTQDND